MVNAERRPIEVAEVLPRRGKMVWRATLLAAAAFVVAAVVANSAGLPAAAELEGPPREVAELEREARKDVENDATSAGLKALSSKDSLAATLTGGLKTKIEDMNAGDKALMNKIMAQTEGKSGASAKVSAIQAVAKKAASAAAVKLSVAKAAPGAHGRDANRQPPTPVMKNVVAAVMRDRKSEMLDMSKALARVALLKKQVSFRAKKEAAVQHAVKGAVKKGKGFVGKKAVVKVATAKALLVKSAQLKKRAAHIRKAALFKALPKERALEAAMTKQKAVLSKLKKEHNLALGKNGANTELRQRKCQKSIQELKLAGDLIKQSNAIGSKLSAKQTTKLQKKSENLTEKAVHTMLESRKMSHKADAEIHQANAVVTRLPALETKARQSKLVLKVLEAQRKSDVAGLKHNKGYEAAVTLSHRLVAESHKDTNLAKGLMKEEHTASGKAKVASRVAWQATAKIIKADHLTATALHHLRLALASEKKNVEDDDSILSALSKR